MAYYQRNFDQRRFPGAISYRIKSKTERGVELDFGGENQERINSMPQRMIDVKNSKEVLLGIRNCALSFFMQKIVSTIFLYE